ncbi:MAG: S-layer homology domain-containing protein [Oscillospiraceae bacterium]|nr:S-layer homology domain-containing protein [Oscillospiraceae bacterium]
MKKRILCLLLAVCLLIPTIPAAAFSDVTDTAATAEIESLRLLGVIDGYPDGSFRPGGTLTRAEFCKMAAYATGAYNQAGQYQAITVFPDVTPKHWASAYINLESKGKGIIYGYPDGTFRPNSTITAGQAVTILMRLLGYTDADVGAAWPDGYLATAASCGLSEGLTLSGGAALTRRQAAQLFSRLLACKTKEGADYAGTLAASTVKDTVLLDSNATASDGTTGAMEFSNGSTYKMAGSSSNGALNGYKGTVLLDSSDRVLTFVPSAAGSYKTVTVSAAKSDALTESGGVKYNMDANITAYDGDEKTTYGALFSWLTPGSVVTLYFGPSGSVEYLFRGATGAVSTDSLVIGSDGATTGLKELSGTSAYTIIKNGVAATVGDLKQYDVVTYDSAANALRVSDTKITGYYENCWPNADAPTKVTVLGHEFDVLPRAASALSGFKVGGQITLLLTADNRVAGAAALTGNNVSAIGLVSSISTASATVELLCGIKVTGQVKYSESQVSNLSGQLVRVSSSQSGYLSLTVLSGGGNATLDVAARKLGDAALSPQVAIYEKVGSSALTAINLGDIPNATVPSDAIAYAGRDWAGRVNLLILKDVTGNCFTYGRVSYSSITAVDEDGDKTTTGHSLRLTYGTGKVLGPFNTAINARTGDFCGFALTADGSKISSIVNLEKLANVPNSAWTDKSTVQFGGKLYPVADDVVCYNKVSDTWLSLTDAHSYAEKATLYADKHGIIRAIEVS